MNDMQCDKHMDFFQECLADTIEAQAAEIERLRARMVQIKGQVATADRDNWGDVIDRIGFISDGRMDTSVLQNPAKKQQPLGAEFENDILEELIKNLDDLGAAHASITARNEDDDPTFFVLVSKDGDTITAIKRFIAKYDDGDETITLTSVSATRGDDE